MTTTLQRKVEAFNKGKLDNRLSQKIKPLSQKQSLVPTQAKQPFDEETATLITWFQEENRLPTEPFFLESAILVKNPAKFYNSLKSDIEVGAGSQRCKGGALKKDLKTLKNIIERGEL